MKRLPAPIAITALNGYSPPLLPPEAMKRHLRQLVEAPLAAPAPPQVVPLVKASEDKAHTNNKVTHEATCGSLDKKQLQTLIARGLDEDD